MIIFKKFIFTDMIIKVLPTLLLLLLFGAVVSAQGFRGTAVIGSNIAQIDEDDWAGFDKFGVTAGGRLTYITDKNIDFSLEMLYSQRGAAERRFAKGDEKNINLSYFEVPLIVSLKDWSMDNGSYYKVRAEAGLSFSYLFDIKNTRFAEENFKKQDFSWLLGVGYQFSKRIGLGLRYTSSFLKIYNDPDLEKDILKSYFITARMEFYF
jgi:outer membrane receptor protein involved in Fe transport